MEEDESKMRYIPQLERAKVRVWGIDRRLERHDECHEESFSFFFFLCL